MFLGPKFVTNWPLPSSKECRPSPIDIDRFRMGVQFGGRCEMKGETHGVGDPQGTWRDKPQSVCRLLYIFLLLASNNKITSGHMRTRRSLTTLMPTPSSIPVLAPTTRSLPTCSHACLCWHSEFDCWLVCHITGYSSICCRGHRKVEMPNAGSNDPPLSRTHWYKLERRHSGARKTHTTDFLTSQYCTAVSFDIHNAIARFPGRFECPTHARVCIPLGFVKPLPWPAETPTLGSGYGFARVRVWVALENPRVTCDNHYS